MNNLPPELQCLIFAFALPVQDERKQIVSAGPTPLTLGAVCTAWRNVVWSSPELWTSPTLKLQNDQEKSTIQAKILEEWLPRAFELPLDIQINAESPSPQLVQVFRIIDGYSSQWRHLALLFPTSAYPSFSTSLNLPLLQSIVILPDNDSFADDDHKLILSNTPQLKSFIMDCNCFYLENLTVRWELLNYLSVESLFLNELFSIICNAPRIINLDLKNVLSSSDNNHIPTQPAILDSLNQLHLAETKPAEATRIFHHIATPRATSFSFESDCIEFPAEDFVALVKRSGCNLTRLSFKGMHVKEEDLTIIFPAVPSLVSFSLLMPECGQSEGHGHPQRPLTDQVFAMLSSATHPCLPVLQAFEYAGNQSFSWDVLLTSLEYRHPSAATMRIAGKPCDESQRTFPPRNHVGSLKSFSIQITESDLSTEVDADNTTNYSRRIAVLRAAGMDIDIHPWQHAHLAQVAHVHVSI